MPRVAFISKGKSFCQKLLGNLSVIQTSISIWANPFKQALKQTQLNFCFLLFLNNVQKLYLGNVKKNILPNVMKLPKESILALYILSCFLTARFEWRSLSLFTTKGVFL